MKDSNITYNEISKLTPEELRQKLIVSQQELNKLRFAHAINPLEKPIRMLNLRKIIARIKTLENERKHTKHQHNA